MTEIQEQENQVRERTLTNHDIRFAKRAFGMIVTGGIVSYPNHVAFQLIGMSLLIGGLIQLRAIEIHSLYNSVMAIVIGIFALDIVHSLMAWTYPDTILNGALMLYIILFLNMVGYFLFSLSMKWFTETAKLRSSGAYWKRAMYMFIVCYIIGLGLLAGSGGMSVHEALRDTANIVGIIGFIFLIIPFFFMVHAVYKTYSHLKHYSSSLDRRSRRAARQKKQQKIINGRKIEENKEGE